MKVKRFAGGLVVAVMAVALMLAGAQSLAAVGEPPTSTVNKMITHTLYPATVLSGSTTAYSSATRVDEYGRQVAYTNGWNSADIFVTVDITPTAVMTVSAQVSADQTNWAAAGYDFVSDALAQTTTVLTTTGTLTSTTSLSNASSMVRQPYRLVFSADGTSVIRVPLAGEYVRVMIEHTDMVTPTVLVTYRN